jgi:hypothetical protein
MKTDLMDEAILLGDDSENDNYRDKQVIDDKDLKFILKLRPEKRNSEQIEIIKNHVKDIKVFKEFN